MLIIKYDFTIIMLERFTKYNLPIIKIVKDYNKLNIYLNN